MTPIGLAISVAYVYSTAVVFGLSGKFFFWELATLIDVMLLGHWIEMASVLGASRALEKLAQLLPDTAHKVEGEEVVVWVVVDVWDEVGGSRRRLPSYGPPEVPGEGWGEVRRDTCEA